MTRRLTDAFRRSALDGEQALALNSADQAAIIDACLATLADHRNWRDDGASGMMSHVLQPYFALAGYKLRATPERAAGHRFDLVGENLLAGDDRILVDYKYNRDGAPRSLIPSAVIEFVASLDPEERSRVIMVSPEGFDAKMAAISARGAGPRLELWSFDDVKARLTALRDAQPVEDAYVAFLLDFIDKLALAIARRELALTRLDWREVERLVAHVLAELGYATHLTQPSQDGGRDVIVVDVAQAGAPVFNIEVKHWTAAQPGRREAKRVLEVALRERRDGAVLWSTNGAAPAAVEAVSESQPGYFHFADGEKLALACRSFARKRGGFWSGMRPFRSFLLNEAGPPGG